MKTLALATLMSLAVAAPALAGPPWLSVELRAAGPFLVVHTFHHGTANPMALAGTAEGIVNGRRTSVPLQFDAIADGNNAYALPRTWGEDGVWVLNIRTALDEHGGAGVVVMLDRNGGVTVRFPRTFDGRSRAATEGEVAAALAVLDTGVTPGRFGRTGWLTVAARMALPLLVLATMVAVLLKLKDLVLSRWRAHRAAPIAT